MQKEMVHLCAWSYNEHATLNVVWLVIGGATILFFIPFAGCALQEQQLYTVLHCLFDSFFYLASCNYTALASMCSPL